MSPKQRYQQDLQASRINRDRAQLRAVDALQVLYEAVLHSGNHQTGWLAGLFKKPKPVPGIYLVGGVGRGKTYLMDMFYECIDRADKMRIHYHRFMLDVHSQLKALPKSPDPLLIIGKRLAEKTRILCLDEFHVTDVADAMLLSGLLKALFRNQVILVTTSNTRINNLYLNGLQRERFMDAIRLLNDYMVEIDLEDGRDYRLEFFEKASTYIVRPEMDDQEMLLRRFQEMAPSTAIEYEKPLLINNREIMTRAMVDDLVWFDFAELCNTPRAASDYLELARLFHTVFISHIPVFHPADDSAAKRFMHLIDALYDHRVKLISTAQAAPADLYKGKLLIGMFDRTVSRLIEMGSHDYLSEAHRI